MWCHCQYLVFPPAHSHIGLYWSGGVDGTDWEHLPTTHLMTTTTQDMIWIAKSISGIVDDVLPDSDVHRKSCGGRIPKRATADAVGSRIENPTSPDVGLSRGKATAADSHQQDRPFAKEAEVAALDMVDGPEYFTLFNNAFPSSELQSVRSKALYRKSLKDRIMCLPKLGVNI